MSPLLSIDSRGFASVCKRRPQRVLEPPFYHPFPNGEHCKALSSSIADTTMLSSPIFDASSIVVGKFSSRDEDISGSLVFCNKLLCPRKLFSNCGLFIIGQSECLCGGKR